MTRTGIVFTDPGSDDWSGIVDFGDGTGEQPLSINSANRSFDLKHVYLSEGTFTVTVRLKDDDSGFISDSFEVSVILNQPPLTHDDTLILNEDASIIDLTGVLGDMGFGLLGNDTDPDGDNVTIVAIDDSTISKGVLQLNAGIVTFDANREFETLALGESAFQTFRYTIADPSGETSTATASIEITGVNDAPTITVAQDLISVLEGQSAANQGSFGDLDANDVISLTATIGTIVKHGNGTWSWSWNTQDGPADSAQVVVTASDGHSEINDSFELVVVNRAPEFQNLFTNANSLESRTSDGTVHLDGTFVDAGLLDTHTVTVNWGDGSAQESISVDQAADLFAGHHEYAHGGIFTILVTLEDSNDAVAEATTQAVVEGLGLVGRTLYFIATDEDDDIKLEVDSKRNEIDVKAKIGHGHRSRKIEQEFAADQVDRVVAYLFGGDDQYEIKQKSNSHSTPEIIIPQLIFGGEGKDRIEADRDYAGPLEIHGQAGDDRIDGGGADDILHGDEGDDRINGGPGSDIIFGGEGDDRLEGGYEGRWEEGNDIIIGGAGDDRIEGGRGRDLLIGGLGEDDIRGNSGGDLLIGGFTAYDQSLDALLSLRAEWTTDRDYEQRINNLRDGTGPILAGTGIRLNASGPGANVSDDSERDRLLGGSGSDWYFAQLAGKDDDDQVKNSKYELIDLLDH